MTEEVQTLIEKRAAIDAQIAEAQRTAKAANIIRVKSLMAETGVTIADLAGRPAAKRQAKQPSAVAYVGEPGQTWSGKGRRPYWLSDALAKGANLNQFKVAA